MATRYNQITAAGSLRRVATACLCALLFGYSTAGSALPSRADIGIRQDTAPLQQRRQWVFGQDGVTFSNRIDGARLNNVERLGKLQYRLTISPETVPVNPSPWYGFSVFSVQQQQLVLDFHYTHAKARYPPWLSHDDGRTWQHPPQADLRKGHDGEISLQVDTGPQRVLVWAQRPVQLKDFTCWEVQLKERIAIDDSVIGASVLGRPLHMLAFGNPQASRVLLVIGRQHPPETTGSRALMAFVDALSSGSPIAVAFRASTRILVVPVMNPDGVVEGNWRTNANGIDLNRDWRDFHQPETRAVRDMLVREVRDSHRTLAFALDFHSTWHDIFYTVTDDPSRAPGGILHGWMGAMHARFPGKITEAPGNADKPVFKSWAYEQYGAPAVTYEVGDTTTDAQLDTLAAFAANTLIELLPAPANAAVER